LLGFSGLVDIGNIEMVIAGAAILSGIFVILNE
jgi:hypothetical protein